MIEVDVLCLRSDGSGMDTNQVILGSTQAEDRRVARALALGGDAEQTRLVTAHLAAEKAKSLLGEELFEVRTLGHTLHFLNGRAHLASNAH